MNGSGITLDTLKIIDAIDRRGSFAAAADELQRVPSALTYAMQKLEESLGVTVFTRQGRRSVLTGAGQVLLNQGRVLLNAVDSMAAEAQRVATGWETRLRIGVETIQPLEPLMNQLRIFLDTHPGLEIDLVEEVLAGTWEALIQDRVDLLVGAPLPVPQHQGIRVMSIGEIRPRFSVSNQHPLAKVPAPVSPEQLRDYRQVIIHDSARLGVPRSTLLFNEKKRFYVQNMAQKIAAQRAGIGFGVLPTECIQPYLQTGEMVILEVEDDIQTVENIIAWKVVNRGLGLKRLIKQLQASTMTGEATPTEP